MAGEPVSLELPALLVVSAVMEELAAVAVAAEARLLVVLADVGLVIDPAGDADVRRRLLRPEASLLLHGLGGHRHARVLGRQDPAADAIGEAGAVAGGGVLGLAALDAGGEADGLGLVERSRRPLGRHLAAALPSEKVRGCRRHGLAPRKESGKDANAR